MEEHIVKILSAEWVTHDVRRFKIEKPAGYSFIPGQATDVAINKPEWKNEKRPFTFTALNDWDHLEFTIKTYPERNGVTNQLRKLNAGDELIIHDVWGAIQYKGEGVFIAGGAGVTPFIAILRQLKKDNKVGNNILLFSNKTFRDIILYDEFKNILGKNFINTLTNEVVPGCDHHFIDEEYLKQKIRNFNQKFYICGPDPMVAAIKSILEKLGGKDAVITVEM
ncbi:MAG: flavodoxin reductase [Sphingobacteriales bacterium UTBCD1]|jgi:ferredoxin-NADP reductase|nr:MAG: flavodoxin reductase [Sphingobacteriales bacterium UTBCD1]